MTNVCNQAFAKGLADTTNCIIHDVWTSVKEHNDSKLPMAPTAIFKSRSLTAFATLAELMCMMVPNQIKISVPKVL